LIIFSLLLVITVKAANREILVPLAGDNINIREQPNAESKVMYKLRIADLVEVIKESSEKTVIGNLSGKWVYVKTGYCKDDRCTEFISGWIFDYYLAYNDRFKRINANDLKSYKGCVGESCLNLIINKDGSFFEKFKVCEDGNCAGVDKKHDCSVLGGYLDKDEYCYKKGHLYKYLRLIWAKTSNGSGSYFFLTQEDVVCVVGDVSCDLRK